MQQHQSDSSWQEWMVACDEKLKCEGIECYEGDHEKECKEVSCASSQLVKDSKGDAERACVMC